MTSYRFYLLNQFNHITKVHVADCDGDDVERTALAFLLAHEVAAAVEAWDRDKRVYRTMRTSIVTAKRAAHETY